METNNCLAIQVTSGLIVAGKQVVATYSIDS